jgi:hypothetical protein
MIPPILHHLVMAVLKMENGLMGKERARDDAIDVVVGRRGSTAFGDVVRRRLERPPWSNSRVSSGGSIRFMRLISIHHRSSPVHGGDVE